jgi:hypothetical protein
LLPGLSGILSAKLGMDVLRDKIKLPVLIALNL